MGLREGGGDPPEDGFGAGAEFHLGLGSITWG